jgi:hypothetical protein
MLPLLEQLKTARAVRGGCTRILLSLQGRQKYRRWLKIWTFEYEVIVARAESAGFVRAKVLRVLSDLTPAAFVM